MSSPFEGHPQSLLFNSCNRFVVNNNHKVPFYYYHTSIQENLFIAYINGQKGCGLFTKATIKSDTSVLVYYGELISSVETEKRHKERLRAVSSPSRELLVNHDGFYSPFLQGEKFDNYILTVKEFVPNSNIVLRTNIDATYMGGMARLGLHIPTIIIFIVNLLFCRFANHSCDPNMKLFMHRENVWILFLFFWKIFKL